MTDTMKLNLPGIMAILYTDTIKGNQVCRDDLWAVNTDELNAIHAELARLRVELTALRVCTTCRGGCPDKNHLAVHHLCEECHQENVKAFKRLEAEVESWRVKQTTWQLEADMWRRKFRESESHLSLAEVTALRSERDRLREAVEWALADKETLPWSLFKAELRRRAGVGGGGEG